MWLLTCHTTLIVVLTGGIHGKTEIPAQIRSKKSYLSGSTVELCSFSVMYELCKDGIAGIFDFLVVGS